MSESASSTLTIERLERWLQINVVVLVIIATTLLAVGQQNLLYAALAAVAAIAATWITDVKQRFHLNPDSTTVAAAVACLVLIIQVIRNPEQSQLLNVANILIYLEVILLLQKKVERTYWSLIALSLLQVIVAAALNLGLVFGLLMGVYVLCAFAALMLLFIVMETGPFLGKKAAAHPVRESNQRGEVDSPLGSTATSRSGDAVLPVWQRARFLGHVPNNAVQEIASRAYLTRLGKMLVYTAAATAVAFLVIPRFNQSTWQSTRQEQVTTVGFTDEVHLDDIGRILENPEQVMRVEFTDMQNRPYQVDGEPYFRGTVLSVYKGNGHWQKLNAKEFRRPLESRSAFDLASTTVQRITLQPGSHNVLFHVAPCNQIENTPRGLELNLHTGVLTLSEDAGKTRGSYQYILGTTAFRNGWQRDLTPLATGWRKPFSRQDHVRGNYPAVTSTADRVLQEQDLLEGSTFQRAKTLEGHFRRTGNYTYNLNVNQNRDQNLDPIEDFVQNHKTGHCEYFAGALTMMLRSQGIPARMVVGYKGGDFNAVGDYYIVRQLHAHAWVEAYLEREEIPEDELDRSLRSNTENGVWLRLDPTPGSIDVTASTDVLPMVTTVREFFDYCQVLWDDYILGLNASRQYQAIYRPIIRGFRGVFSRDVWKNRWTGFRAWTLHLTEQRWLGIPLLVLLVGGVVVLVGAVLWGRRWLQHQWRRLLMWLHSTRASRRTASPSWAVYRQLESVLADTFGLTRAPGQTVQEFAHLATARLNDHSETAAWSDLPNQVSSLYYQVRFGKRQLSSAEVRPVAERIRTLMTAAATINSDA